LPTSESKLGGSVPFRGTEEPETRYEASILIASTSAPVRRSLKATLRELRYRVLECDNALETLDLVSREEISVAVIDSTLPGMSGIELCRWLKVNGATRLVPVLVVSSSKSVRDETEAFRAGADDFLAQPLNPLRVRARVASLVRHKHLMNSLESAEAIVFSLAQTVERRDHFTGEHCHRLAVYSIALGKAVGVCPGDLLSLYRGGYLHDIGKIGIPDSILFKPGPLNPAEWEIMRSHPARGEEICRPMKSIAAVLPIIRHHHERWDGSGYPDGLRGEQIPLLARVLQICDIYDALTGVRTYKPALGHNEAIGMIREEARKGWRDPEMVSLFEEVSQNSFAAIMTPGALEFSGMLSMHHSIVDSALVSAPDPRSWTSPSGTAAGQS
jgi:putative two-component system response regulator